MHRPLLVGGGCSCGRQCPQSSHLGHSTTRFSSIFFLLKQDSFWRCGCLNVQTHLNTLVILKLLPQLQVELWATKEATYEKHGPSFLMTKAILTGIGVPFSQNLDGLQIRSTLLSPVPSVASL